MLIWALPSDGVPWFTVFRPATPSDDEVDGGPEEGEEVDSEAEEGEEFNEDNDPPTNRGDKQTGTGKRKEKQKKKIPGYQEPTDQITFLATLQQPPPGAGEPGQRMVGAARFPTMASKRGRDKTTVATLNADLLKTQLDGARGKSHGSTEPTDVADATSSKRRPPRLLVTFGAPQKYLALSPLSERRIEDAVADRVEQVRWAL